MLRELVNIIGFELDESKLHAVESKIQSAFSALTNRGNAIGNLLQAAAIPTLGVIAVKAFEEWNVSLAEVGQRLISTGFAAGKTKDELVALTEEASKGLDTMPDDVLKAEAALLKFQGVAGDTFDRVIKSSIDFAAANRMELVPTVQLLGRVLQNPGERMMALERQGVHFTKTEKAKLQALQETGRQEEAQRFILDRLERSYKGAAKAINDAETGEKKFHKSLQELSQEFGRILFPYFKKFYGFLTGIIDYFRNMPASTKNFIVALSAVASAILGIVALAPIIQGIIPLFNPWVLAIVAIGVALALLIDDIRAWASGNKSFLGSVLGSWQHFVQQLQIFFLPFVDIFLGIWENIKGIFISAFQLIKDLFTGNTAGAQTALTNLFGNLFGFIEKLVLDFPIMLLVKLGPILWKALYTFFDVLRQVLWTLLQVIISDIWGLITGFFGNIISWISNEVTKNPILQGLSKILGTAGKEAGNFASGLFGAGSNGVSPSSLAPSPALMNQSVNNGKKVISIEVNQTIPPGTKGDHADFIKKTTKDTFEHHFNSLLRGALANTPGVP